MYSSFWLLVLDVNIFIIVATVPTGLKNWAKVLQMHLSGGGGTPWMQPKSNVTFKLAPLDVFKFLASGLGCKYLHYIGHCAHRVEELGKSAANANFGGGVTPWMQPKSNVTLKLASLDVLKFLASGLGCKYFHYSGHCAHRVEELGKSAANAPFRGWGDTLDATQK